MRQIDTVTATYVASVVYDMPTMEELKRRFPVHVDPRYDGIFFEPISAFRVVSRDMRSVEFELVHPGKDGDGTGKVLVDLTELGLRPALPEELLVFDANYPVEMTIRPIFALGSKTRIGGDHHFMRLHDHLGRHLDLYCPYTGWHQYDRFLAVRE